MDRTPRAWAFRYGSAVGLTVLAAASQVALDPVFDATPFAPFLLAVMISAWVGGIGPALLSTVLGLGASAYVLSRPPLVSLGLQPPGLLAQIVSYLLVALFITWLHTRLQLARARAEAAQSRFRDIVEGLDAIVWEADAETGAFTFVSRRAEAILGYPPERWLEDAGFWEGRLVPEDRTWAVPLRREVAADGTAPGLEYRVVAADGQIVWVREIRYARETGRPADSSCGLFIDITETKQLEADLRRLTGVDELTGLANRRQLNEALAREWRRAGREHRPLAAIMIDVDGFKGYNDRHGHQAGDECLRRVAAVVRGSIHRPGDLAARFGGDELAVLLPGTDLAGALAWAEKARREIAAIDLPAAPGRRVTASFGVAAEVPRPDAPAGALIAAADRALYEAKQAGRDCVRATVAVAAR